MLVGLEFLAVTALILFSGTRLTRYGDIISEKSGLSRLWLGTVLMAGVTSLPELATGLSAVATGLPDIAAGNVVQWRNLAVFEINHDLMNLAYDLDILYPLKALDISAKYHMVGRFMYEAIYDVGPQAFQDVRAADKENIDKFKEQYDLWEFYFDLSRGPLFLRLGKQNLAWGETDTFRLLDAINPLDNTFGGPFADLDDRRIPLWMLRGSYNFGSIGPISSTMIEAFWVPGNWDVSVAPYAPAGTAYAAPIPDTGMRKFQVRPGKTMSNSRWGVRLMGVLGNNLNLSVAHYKTFLDMPTAVLGVEPGTEVVTGTSSLFQELIWEDVQITGGSFNYCDPRTDIIWRGEVAWFWDEPVFIPEENAPLLLGVVESGTIPTKNVLRYCLGVDRKAWIRPLNSRQMFFFSAQYFGQWIPDYDGRQRQPLPEPPTGADFADIKQYEQTLTLLLAGLHCSGQQAEVRVRDGKTGQPIPFAHVCFQPLNGDSQQHAITGDIAYVTLQPYRQAHHRHRLHPCRRCFHAAACGVPPRKHQPHRIDGNHRGHGGGHQGRGNRYNRGAQL